MCHEPNTALIECSNCFSGSCGKFYGYLRDSTAREKILALSAATQKAPEASPPTLERQSLFEHTEPAVVAPEPCRLGTKVRRGGIDYKELRQLVSMADVLGLINYQPTSTHGDQLRGPCPVHGSTSKRPRSFSVDVRGGRFQCFKPACGVKGNQLDLWVAVTEMPLYDAALDLCDKMQIEPPWAA